jgi:hypothetical protein
MMIGVVLGIAMQSLGRFRHPIGSKGKLRLVFNSPVETVSSLRGAGTDY